MKIFKTLTILAFALVLASKNLEAATTQSEIAALKDEIMMLKDKLIKEEMKNGCYERSFVEGQDEALNKFCEDIGCGYSPKICDKKL